MAPPDTWTLDELITRYELEPSLQDIFVEGPSDKRILGWFLHRNGISAYTIYAIDTVDIPAHITNRCGCSGGARGRVIALARTLEADLTSSHASVMCIIDNDFDRLLGREITCAFLVYTDHTSIEAYLLNELTLNTYCSAYLSQTGLTGETLIEAIDSVLRELFLIRLTIAAMQLSVAPLPFARYCTVNTEGALEFDDVRYFANFFTTRGCCGQEDEFQRKREEVRLRLPHDVRDCCHGKDLIAILRWYTHRRGSRVYPTSEEFLERTLFCCIENDPLKAEPLFQRLLS